MIYGGEYDASRFKRLPTREWGSVLSFQIYTRNINGWNLQIIHLKSGKSFEANLHVFHVNFQGKNQAWTSSKHWCQESLDIAKMQPVAQVQCMDGDYFSLLEEMQQWSLEKLGVAQFLTFFEGLRNIWQLSHFCCSKICPRGDIGVEALAGILSQRSPNHIKKIKVAHHWRIRNKNQHVVVKNVIPDDVFRNFRRVWHCKLVSNQTTPRLATVPQQESSLPPHSRFFAIGYYKDQSRSKNPWPNMSVNMFYL